MRWILLPGLDGTGRLLEPLREAWGGSAEVETIVYPIGGPQDYPFLESYVRARLPDDGPFAILGESFGGPLAYRIASDPPPNLHGVAFSVTFLTAPRPVLARIGRLLPPWMIRRRAVGMLGRFLLRALMGSDETDDLRELLQDVMAKGDPATIHDRLRAIAALPQPTKPVEIPSVYLRAERDRVVPSRCERPFHDICKDLRVHAIDGPHLLLETRPRECVAILEDEARRMIARPTP